MWLRFGNLLLVARRRRRKRTKCLEPCWRLCYDLAAQATALRRERDLPGGGAGVREADGYRGKP